MDESSLELINSQIPRLKEHGTGCFARKFFGRKEMKLQQQDFAGAWKSAGQQVNLWSFVTVRA
jgi:hypothetical protein